MFTTEKRTLCYRDIGNCRILYQTTGLSRPAYCSLTGSSFQIFLTEKSGPSRCKAMVFDKMCWPSVVSAHNLINSEDSCFLTSVCMNSVTSNTISLQTFAAIKLTPPPELEKPFSWHFWNIFHQATPSPHSIGCRCIHTYAYAHISCGYRQITFSPTLCLP